MIKEYQNQVFKVFIIVLLLLVCSLFCFIIYISKIRIQDNSNNYTKEILKTRFYTSDEMNITNILPISDVLGKKMEHKDVEDGIQDIIEFEITNDSDYQQSYDIFLTKKSFARNIDDNYIKFYLTDMSNVPFEKFSYDQVPTFYSLNDMDSLKETKILYSGNIFKKNHQKFRLRMWVSDSYSLNQDMEKFGVNVGVRLREKDYGK
ncbi:MAG: hypothetical protein IKE70_05645 [Bacilli bacterium]|nr:hypothetical protein [Bacilli bacterium]